MDIHSLLITCTMLQVGGPQTGFLSDPQLECRTTIQGTEAQGQKDLTYPQIYACLLYIPHFNSPHRPRSGVHCAILAQLRMGYMTTR